MDERTCNYMKNVCNVLKLIITNRHIRTYRKYKTQSYCEHIDYSLHSTRCVVFICMGFALATSSCCPAGLYMTLFS